MDSSSLTIGQVAKGAGVGVETVRFYEREGLVPAPKRRPSGYRQYPADTVRRIRFVQAAKDLGFTLKEIRELLSLRVAAGKLRKSSAETPLTTTPAAATHIIVVPCGSVGV
jgi:DNA-binding transcriptional MerR regulator